MRIRKQMRRIAPQFVACTSGMLARSAQRRHFSKLCSSTAHFALPAAVVATKGGSHGRMATIGAIGNNEVPITKLIVLVASQLEI